MTRYILIDNNSGYIWGDTDFFRKYRNKPEMTPMEFVKTVDEDCQEYGRTYSEGGPGQYYVYHAPKNFPGTDDYDSQNQTTLELLDDAELAAIIAYEDKAE